MQDLYSHEGRESVVTTQARISRDQQGLREATAEAHCYRCRGHFA